MIKYLLAISTLSLLGCASKPGHSFTEPTRTKFVALCMLQGGYSVTSCLCQEQGVLNLTDGDAGLIDQIPIPQLQKMILECGQPIFRESAPVDEPEEFTRG